jgi:hypothetical protein
MQDREIEGLVLDALRRANVPVSMLDWDFYPDLNELQLVIATSLFNTAGPHEANARVLEALQYAGIYHRMPIRRIVVASPEDPKVKAVEQEMKLRAEGSIHIVENPTSSGDKKYSIMFTPYTSSGGAVRAQVVTGRDQLISFLTGRLEIQTHHVASALVRLDTERSASISNVQLTLRKARKLGLA